jgi:hypothetical protein
VSIKNYGNKRMNGVHQDESGMIAGTGGTGRKVPKRKMVIMEKCFSRCPLSENNSRVGA